MDHGLSFMIEDRYLKHRLFVFDGDLRELKMGTCQFMVTLISLICLLIHLLTVIGERGNLYFLYLICFGLFITSHRINEDSKAVKVIDEAIEIFIDVRITGIEVSQVIDRETLTTLVHLLDLVTANIEVKKRIPVISVRIWLSSVNQAL